MAFQISSFGRGLTFRGKLIVSIVPVLAVAVGFLTLVSYRLAERAILAQQDSNMEAMVTKTLDELNTWIDDREREAEVLSQKAIFQNAVRTQNAKEVTAALENIHRLSPVYENVFLADANGRLFADSIGGKSIGVEIAKIPGFSINLEKARENKVWMGDVMPSPATGRPVALVTAPILVDGKFAGLVGTPIELNAFSDKYISHVKFGHSGYLVILDQNGLAVAHPDKERILKTNFLQFDWCKDVYQRKNGLLRYTFEGVKKTGHFATSTKKGWVVLGVMPLSELYDPLQVIKYASWGLGLIVILGITGIIWMVTQQIFKVVSSVTSELSGGADRVSNAATQIAGASTSLSSSTTEQAAALQQTVSSVDEVNAMVGKNAEAARKSSEVSHASSETAERGKRVVAEMIRAIDDINQSNGEIVNQIETSNQRISDIVRVIIAIGDKTKVINEIVFQTKLLSFNASVEAARAGEHGKGFAVVAEEVGSLAQMSGNAAKDISQMLDDSIRQVEQIVAETKTRVGGLIVTGKEKVAAGTATARRCGEVLDEVVSNVQQVNTFVDEIATASGEQAQGVQEITKAMAQLDQVTQQNASAAEQTAGAANKLTRQAEQLHETVQTLLVTVYGKQVPSATYPQSRSDGLEPVVPLEKIA